MLDIRPREARGRTRLDWLDSYHTFSFGDYYDPNHHHFGALRVINDDVVQPGQGFSTHPHRDMEIITVVLSGALQHQDSLGTGSVIRPGDVQRMSAGTGVLHSEFNASDTEPVHLLQIWIMPAERGLPPSYEQKSFVPEAGKLQVIASPDGRDGSVTIHQDALLSQAQLRVDQVLDAPVADGRMLWLHVATGEIRLEDGTPLVAGDSGSWMEPRPLRLTSVLPDTRILVFDLKKSA